jgi:hypothetical protein
MWKQLIMIQIREFRLHSNFFTFFSSVGMRYNPKRDSYRNFAAYSITNILLGPNPKILVPSLPARLRERSAD